MSITPTTVFYPDKRRNFIEKPVISQSLEYPSEHCSGYNTLYLTHEDEQLYYRTGVGNLNCKIITLYTTL